MYKTDAEYEHAYQCISQELKTPVLTLAGQTVSNLRNFVYGTYFKTIDKLQLIKHQNQNNYSITDISDEIEANFIYSDLAPLRVFVPPTMAKKAQMIEYASYMNNCINIANTIAEHNGEEALNTIMRFIGSPGQLRDVTQAGLYTDHTNEIKARIDGSLDIGKGLINTQGTDDTRIFREVYKRNKDYYSTINMAIEFNRNYGELVGRMKALDKRIGEVNSAAEKLMHLIATEPDRYAIGNAAAIRLTNSCYQFAKEMEFVGQVLHNGQVFIKSIIDTNIVVGKLIK